jgi:formate-nitrite transporter family protein
MARQEPHVQEDEASAEESESSSTGLPTVGTRLTAREIYDNVRLTAEEELKRPNLALFWSALAAGLVIGFSFLASGYLRTLAPDGLKDAFVAAGYPLGFIFVVLARNQLFTENTLEPIIPLLHKPSWPLFIRLLQLWAIILFGNLIGTFVMAGLLAYTPVVESSFHGVLHEVAGHSTSGSAANVLYRAVFGGWLIALMTWLIASTRATGAQIAMVWLTTAPIGAFGFRHSIAGSVEAFYLAFTRAAAWTDTIFDFTIPSIFGNIIGGFLFVALLNHGQVAAEQKAKG